ncbi:ATP-binding cassette sub- C member 8, partial [Kappamyces sp. JEL0680]
MQKPDPIVVRQEAKRIRPGILEHLTFSYLNPLLRLGLQRPTSLDPSDYFPVEQQDEAHYLSSGLVARLKSGKSLVRAMVEMFWQPLVLTGICFLLDLVLKVSEATFLARLINWFGQETQDNRGYLYCGILCVLIATHALLRHRQFFSVMRMGVQVKVAVTTAVYRKCLALSISHTASTGKITNLIANDVQKFEDAAVWFHFMWCAPIELFATWMFIYFQIGLASLAPLVTLLLLFPIQLLLARLFGRLRVKTVWIRDEWIKRISDVIAGIKLIKLYAWESPFASEIQRLRNVEMSYMQKGYYVSALNNCLFFSSPAILGTATTLCFYYLGGVLTPAIVFSVYTLLNTLRITMFADFPKGVRYFFESLV